MREFSKLMRSPAFAICWGVVLGLGGGHSQTLPASGQAPAPRPGASVKKHVLVIGQTTIYHHPSVSDSMGLIWKLGKESGIWETELRTGTELVTKKKLDNSNPNLDYFDAIVFANTTGELQFDDEQKRSLLSFVHDDGKGYVGMHSSVDGNYKWPEYAEMTGAYFDGHPWGLADNPILVEDPTFPAVRHFPSAFLLRDDVYQFKNWTRDKVNVLMRMDETKLDYKGKDKARPDHDFAIAWSKMYGKGRVFYSTIGHTNDVLADPDVQKMYLEAVKWVLGRTEGSTTSHAKTPAPAK